MKIGYARVSTQGQDLDQQRAALLGAGCTGGLYLEKESGLKRDREQLNAMLKQLRPGDVVTITKLDRLARSMLDLLGIAKIIEAAGAELVALDQAGIDTTTPSGKLLFTMLGAVAEFERDLIVERTSRGRVAAMARGVRFGPRPKINAAALATAKAAIAAGQPVTRVAHSLKVSRATLYSALKQERDAVAIAS